MVGAGVDVSDLLRHVAVGRDDQCHGNLRYRDCVGAKIARNHDPAGVQVFDRQVVGARAQRLHQLQVAVVSEIGADLETPRDYDIC